MEEGRPAIIVSRAGPLFVFRGRGGRAWVDMYCQDAQGKRLWEAPVERGDADVADPAGTFNESWGPHAGLSASDAGVLTVQVPSLRGGGVV